ncbi:MAG: hypothetical protein Q9212_001826 [Teloschistes hypoglaucus]
MALIAAAESAQEVAVGFNKFLDPVPEISTEITALMSECYAISSELQKLHIAKEDQRYYHDYNYIYTDVLSVRQSLDSTFGDIIRLFGDLGRPGHISRRAAYHQVWREIDSHFYQESRFSLCKRLEYNRLFLKQLNFILIDGRPLDVEDFYDLRDRTDEILHGQESRLDSAFNNLSLSDPAANRQRSFERRRPPALFTQAPEPPLWWRGGARRPGPVSPQSPPGFDEYPWAPPPPNVPTSPTTTTTFSTQSSINSSSRDHWLPRVFEQTRPSTDLRHAGEVSSAYGVDRKDASDRLNKTYVKLLDIPFENGELQVRLYYRKADQRARMHCRVSRNGRHASTLKLSHKHSSGRPSELWACLRFASYERLVLFHCAFIALRTEDLDEGRVKPLPLHYFGDEHIHGEEIIYAGVIIDDHFQHAIRVLQDRDCRGIRLQASVRRGELKGKPVWTAFITTHIESRRWMRRENSKTIYLADLQQYIFSSEYNAQLGPAGQHELRFDSSRDGKTQLQQPPSSESSDSIPVSIDSRDEPSVIPKTWQKALSFILYTPKRCRYDAANPPRFSLPLNLLFGFAGAFTVANLYYSHPILHLLAGEFGISNERASLIPTFAQAGYASGLLFLCPLGDVFPRRLYVLSLVFFTATVWLGLCLTNSFAIFCFLTFLTSLTTVTPQLMLPLVGDLAPPNRRATALSIVVSGLMMGLLLARLLSGAVTNYTPWRTIYWIAFGLQYLIFALLWLFMPDYPSTNPAGINYFRILWSILTIFIHHPLLVQACLIAFCTSITFTSFWTTLTFLLSSPPYEYSTLVIGLFALIGIASMLLGPLYSRHVTDRFIPLFSVVLGLCICLTGTIIGTYTGTFSVGGPVYQAFALDFGIQTSQIANRSAIYGILPQARNRVNTAFMLSAFCGQLTGTALGNHIYAIGGWKSSGSTSIGFLSAALLLCAARGPREPGWYGWGGGWSLRRKTDVEVAGEKQSQLGGEKDSEGGDAAGSRDDQERQDDRKEPDDDEKGESGQASDSGERVMKVSAYGDLSKTKTTEFAGMSHK